MVKALRVFWPIAALALTALVIGKFILAALLGNTLQVLAAAFGVTLCFYLLFMLEGLQVAGLEVKRLEGDAIDRFLERHPVRRSKHVIPIYETFKNNFDGFVTGRQVFVIMTVVAIALLVKSVRVPSDEVTLATFYAFLQLESGSVIALSIEKLINFVNDARFPENAAITPFAFFSATLVPAWWCQLLSQFLAEGRAIHFIALPGARPVLRLAMILDRVQLGQPAKVMLNQLMRTGRVGPRHHVPIGKETYYDASLNFYGRGKAQHDIRIILGKPSKVRERITYVFRRGGTKYLDHKVELASPMSGLELVNLYLPPDVSGRVIARVQDGLPELQFPDSGGLYGRHIRIELDTPLPREGVEEDTAVLEFQYETNAYTDHVGQSQTVEFYSHLPIASAEVSIEGTEWLLNKPTVRMAEVEGELFTVPDDVAAEHWEVSTPTTSDNTARIKFEYPVISSGYQIEFEVQGARLATSG